MRVVIAEDSVLMRDGLVRLLGDRRHKVVATVGDPEALLAAVTEHVPDIAVVDVRMPPTHTDEGLRAAVRLRVEQPETKILVLSQYVEERYAAELLAGNRGGVGYLLKERVADVGDFLDAVDRVGSGDTVLDPEVVSQIFARSQRSNALEQLTPRERDVLGAMAEGLTNTGIAERLVVSEGAVEKHASNIFMKLQLPPGETTHRRVVAVLTYLGV